MSKITLEKFRVAFFLAKFGRSKIPKSHKVDTWNSAYDLFYNSLNQGKSKDSFRNSLKNVRDTLDGYFENGRRGWYVDGEPLPISKKNKVIFDQLNLLSSSDAWQSIESIASNEPVLFHVNEPISFSLCFRICIYHELCTRCVIHQL